MRDSVGLFSGLFLVETDGGFIWDWRTGESAMGFGLDDIEVVVVFPEALVRVPFALRSIVRACCLRLDST